MKPRIVFACSGSAENLAAIPKLSTAFDAEIVALTLDVGQARDLEGVRQAALAAGAVRAHVLDAREEFARHCIVASLDEQTPTAYTTGHALARPLIARKLIEIAHIEGGSAIAHGGDREDQTEIEEAAHALDRSIRVIAAHDGAAPDVRRAVHTTLWERSPDERSSALPKPELDAPARLEIAFEAGLPVAINGVPMTLTELIESVTTIAANHGVGRVTDTSGTPLEAPAAVVFQAAHEALGGNASRASGATVCLELFKGQHRVLSAQHS